MENKLSMYIHRKEISFRENNRISNIGFGSNISDIYMTYFSRRYPIA